MNIELDQLKAMEDGLLLFQHGQVHSMYNPSLVNNYLLQPIKHNRIRLYYKNDKPVGLVTWCWLDKEKSKAFLNDEYSLTEDDYKKENPEGYDLWGVEFISTDGDARSIMKSIRKEHKKLYGKTTKVNFRRFYDRNTLHRRTF